MLNKDIQKKSNHLLQLLMGQSRLCEKSKDSAQGIPCLNCLHHPKQKIQEIISQQSPLTLILPAFPAKSSNRQKTLSANPDRGEIR